ncbi:MAG: AAA family ATPase [Opitutales bacterium]
MLSLPPKRPFACTTETLTKPTNKETKRIFIAATRQNDGKTTTCLGLFAALQALFPRVGFIKPIGQRFIEVEGHKIDEDSILLDKIYDVHVPIDSMSPVAVDHTFTRRYLADPERCIGPLISRICHAFDRVSWEKDFTIIEGTGHAGVGSVFDLSNARVARLLNAKAIIVSRGGIGRPIDEIAMNKALFDKEGVEVVGAILNKVHPEKLETVKKYAGLGLERLGVPLLGVLPDHKILSAPNLYQVAEEIDGRWINGKSYGLNERIHHFVIGTMTAKGMLDYLKPGVLIITAGDREDILLAAIANVGISGKKGISGIILTRDIMPHPRLMELLAQTNISVISVSQDSYLVASQIAGMTIKTQPQDDDKIPLIKRLILENVDIKRLINAF